MENILILIGLVLLLIIVLLIINPSSKFTYIGTNGTTGTIIYIFFAPWCVHCKKSKTLFERLNTEFNNVMLVDSDSDNQADKDLLIKYNVKGFPTIKNSKNIEFKDDRTYEKLVDFIQKS